MPLWLSHNSCNYLIKLQNIFLKIWHKICSDFLYFHRTFETNNNSAKCHKYTSVFMYSLLLLSCFKKKVKWSRYRPGMAQRVGRGIPLLFHDRGTGRGWVVSSTPQPQFTPGKDPVPIVQEAGWASGLVWTGGKSRPHQDSNPDHPTRSQSLYRPGKLPGPQCHILTKIKFEWQISI